MTTPFQTRFTDLARERSALCVGIDPSAESLKEWGLADDAAGLLAFCERMVAVCAPLVAAIKPQVAFFERHGAAGMEVLHRTVTGIHYHGALAIIDAKCGDIASTATAYGETFLGPNSPFGGDALTLTPYLGFGSLQPILDIAEREAAGVFVLVRSSNPEGAELQQAIMADGRSVAERLADDIAARNRAGLPDALGPAGLGPAGLGPIGAVVGGTLGAEVAALASRMPNALLLVPGIGAQGATIADVRNNFASHYGRVIPSVSRSIARAGPDPDALKRRVEQHVAEVGGASPP
jgi:orotidine-5'-phosphate decarboxylase